MRPPESFGLMDGNEAAATVAYQTNEVIAIYPITPSTAMGEASDAWASQGKPNLWGAIPTIQEMQSEGGASGALHGALQTGALATTFTASQGLLLMIPSMFKIAGELTPTVFHVASRSIATHALSIFGDHSDVMAARSTGWAMLFAASVQEAHDFALIAQAATLQTRIPFLHVFDGFRTSHELMKIKLLSNDDLLALLDPADIAAHRQRSLSPDRPVIRGTSQNPDTFFQGREAANPFFLAVPSSVQGFMDRLAERTGRRYRLFEYTGSPEAERVIVLLGSGCEAAEETVARLTREGDPVGVLKVRLFRPFAADAFFQALPKTTRALAVLDRTKEPNAQGEPLFQDVTMALYQRAQKERRWDAMPTVIGGRYGLGSKEFTPAMIRAVFQELQKDEPKTTFTLGIHDDQTHLSLPFDASFSTEDPDTYRAIFWGLGSDGTVSANKNTIKIIGEQTDLHTQGYFVYDSKKAGARTISHLRFGPKPIRSTYLIDKADFIGIHQASFVAKYPVLDAAKEGSTILLNTSARPEEVWRGLPRPAQEILAARRCRLFAIDGYKIAADTGMRGRINTIMQTCFFALSPILPQDTALAQIKAAIEKTYGKRGIAIIDMNFRAIEKAASELYEVPIPSEASSLQGLPPPVSPMAPALVQSLLAPMIAGQGDALPVSAFPADGTYPCATSQWEKRDLAEEIPVWDPDLCIQCGKCVLVCPHAVIRAKRFSPQALQTSPPPDDFQARPARWRETPEALYSLQVSPSDCTGCRLCVEICPVKDKRSARRKALHMEPKAPIHAKEEKKWSYFLSLLDTELSEGLSPHKVKDVQLLRPLFEFSGACAGCGETPYLKLLSQLYGDRCLIANATGCSSIYGGNLPTTPWAVNRHGRGPAWSNSLFEDNAEFGLGMRLALDQQARYAATLLARLDDRLPPGLAKALLEADQTDDKGVIAQRERVALLKEHLSSSPSWEDRRMRELWTIADTLVRKSVWIVGGDGWAYDIGFGGLDHVLASGASVKMLVLDTEVYSNTGGQASKATPRAAVAKFATSGKTTAKKDLGQIAMGYGSIYVAKIALGADDSQTLQAFREAEDFNGPALILAYSPCIAHGIEMHQAIEQQKKAVASGHWFLYRYNPARRHQGENPFILDSSEPSLPLKEYLYNEARYRMLLQSSPDTAKKLLLEAQSDVAAQWERLSQMAKASSSSEAQAL